MRFTVILVELIVVNTMLFHFQTLKLSAPLATGLILVSCCPGGQASNVATYISKGNVALSVLMTTYASFTFMHIYVCVCVSFLFYVWVE